MVPIDNLARMDREHIFEIDDVAGELMLAQKVSREGEAAAEVVEGEPVVLLIKRSQRQYSLTQK